MLKIQRSSNGGVVFSVSGRIEFQDVAELQRILGAESDDLDIVLDLKEVTLVDRDAVRFLARCEAEGVRFENCPAYVREWIEADRGRRSRQKQ
jgi:hypothetical protein